MNRDGQTKTFNFRLAEMPAGAAEKGTERPPEENASPEKTTVFGGVGVTNITDDIRTALNLPKDVQGAVLLILMRTRQLRKPGCAKAM